MIHSESTVRSDAVRDLQTALRIRHYGTPPTEAAETEPSPLLVSDGIYGEETAAAVRAFQQEAGLPVTGNADPGTWDALMRDSGARRADGSPGAPVIPVCFPAVLDDPGHDPMLVSMIQLLLSAVSGVCGIGKPPAVTGVYDESTASAAAAVQQICGLSPTGRTDLRTWNCLASLYNTEMKKIQTGKY